MISSCDRMYLQSTRKSMSSIFIRGLLDDVRENKHRNDAIMQAYT